MPSQSSAGSSDAPAAAPRAGADQPQALTETGPLAGGPASGQPGSAPRLDNSSRRINKATLVSIQLPPLEDDLSSGALLKFSFVRQLGLQQGEVSAVLGSTHDALNTGLADLLTPFEGAPIPSQLPSPTQFAAVAASSLTAFGRAVVELRTQALQRLSAGSAPGDAAIALNAVNAGTIAINWFEASVTATPIGALNLERLEMTPVGIERGGLIATIPLAPLEKTAVVHKEWSVTTKEFTSIVTDSLENFSETGVTENTELAQSTQSQTSHSDQFNVNGTVTGNFGPVTTTVSSGFTTQSQASDSANASRKHGIETTRKASARVKQEHKVTVSTTTVTGTSDSSTRILENRSSTTPIRIDYFSIMRKWHVGLYRYGLRLTYDIAIPEPGAAMRGIYAELDTLRGQVGPFVFDVKHSDITVDKVDANGQPDANGIPKYLWLADQKGAQVPLAPPPPPPIVISNPVSGLSGGDNAIRHFQQPFRVPDTSWIASVTLVMQVSSPAGIDINVDVVGSTFHYHGGNTTQQAVLNDAVTGGKFLEHGVGDQNVVFVFQGADAAAITLTVDLELTPETIEQWQMDVWNALYNAAQTQYYANQQDISARITALENQLANVDTLTLRREENEEVMKGVLRWLLGPSFDFMPQDVRNSFEKQQPPLDLKHGTAFDSDIGDGLHVTAAGWYPMFAYQEMVKFINEAIEWESVLYFLYSYFWDVPQSWKFIRELQHPDSRRQAFLRAGSARVVLTVRKGWEDAWTTFVEAGGFDATLIQHPYLAIAKEIQLYDDTNYPGIPSANPAGGALPDDNASVASGCRQDLAKSAAAVSIPVDSSDGFLVGYTAIIDDYASGVQETQTIVAVPDATHITVEALANSHSAASQPIPIMQGGEKGQLIAEWFEYTPTSGTDIAVTSNLATIS